MAKKQVRKSAGPKRKPLNVYDMDRVLWKRFKNAAEAQGRKPLYHYLEEALREKLERDGF